MSILAINVAISLVLKIHIIHSSENVFALRLLRWPRIMLYFIVWKTPSENL